MFRLFVLSLAFVSVALAQGITPVTSVTAQPSIHTGSPLSPSFSTTPAGATLSYTVVGGSSSTTATNVGTYTVNWTATGNFSGSGSTTWSIVPASLNLSSPATSPTAFTVPSGVTSLKVEAWGAGGSGGSNSGGFSGTPGGAGGFASATFSVTPGQTLYYVVGSGAGAHTSTQLSSVGLPGGSSDGSPDQGSGGGFTGLFTSSSLSQASALLIAGGGAGGGRVTPTYFNNGNGLVSSNQAGGNPSANGPALQGSIQGGGGYLGGAGFGGSSFIAPSGLTPLLISNANGSNIAFNLVRLAPNTSHPAYSSPAAQGGLPGGDSGKNGQLILSFITNQGQTLMATSSNNSMPNTQVGPELTYSYGINHSLIIANDGTLWSRGSNEFGQLGCGNKQTSSEWALVKFEGLAKSVLVTDTGSLAIDTKGRLWIWGKHTLVSENRSIAVVYNLPVLAKTVAENALRASKGNVYIELADGVLYGIGKIER